MSESESSYPLSPYQIALIGAGAVVVGAFLPWATGFGFSRVGITSVDGIITFVTGAAVGVYLYLKKFTRRGVLFGGGVCSIIGGYDTAYPLSTSVLGAEVASGFNSPGVGVYLTLFGGLILLGSGIAHSNQ
jgi:hypothetical protein